MGAKEGFVHVPQSVLTAPGELFIVPPEEVTMRVGIAALFVGPFTRQQERPSNRQALQGSLGRGVEPPLPVWRSSRNTVWVGPM
jgi:hypothetical protein